MAKNQKQAEEMAGKAPEKKKSKPKPGTAATTSISVDEEECQIADAMMANLEAQKGKATLRMLRVNRISILRLALGLGLEELVGRAEKNEPIL